MWLIVVSARTARVPRHVRKETDTCTANSTAIPMDDTTDVADTGLNFNPVHPMHPANSVTVVTTTSVTTRPAIILSYDHVVIKFLHYITLATECTMGIQLLSVTSKHYFIPFD